MREQQLVTTGFEARARDVFLVISKGEGDRFSELTLEELDAVVWQAAYIATLPHEDLVATARSADDAIPAPPERGTLMELYTTALDYAREQEYAVPGSIPYPEEYAGVFLGALLAERLCLADGVSALAGEAANLVVFEMRRDDYAAKLGVTD